MTRLARLVINPRGTSGSGKTYLMRAIMDDIGVRYRMHKKGSQKITGYELKDGSYVLGSYKTECGGADTIKTLDEVGDRVRKAVAKYQTVIFEGVLVSDVFGRYLELSKGVHPPAIYVWGILDTPLDVCIERVIARRVARGVNKRPFDPKKHTIPRYDKVVKGMNHAINEGQLVVLLDHKNVTTQVLRIIKYRKFPRGRTHNLELYKKEGIGYDE